MKHRTLLGRTQVSALKRFIYRPPCEPAINYLVLVNDRRNERAKLIQFNTRASIRDRPLLLSLSSLATSKEKQTAAGPLMLNARATGCN